MGSAGWTPPDSEERLGLGFYATHTPGVAGQLKRDPEDFRVSEISLYPMPQEDGPFTVLRVVSRNWEQHELSDRIAQRLGLPPHSIRWAGTKDRRAIAERLASYRGFPPSRPLDLAGVEVVEAYRARDGLVLGHHFGNSFVIRLTGLSGDGDLDRLEGTRNELLAQGGFPNLFGAQRFGEVRPVTHEVGRLIVRGDLPGAVDCYLTALPPGEDGLGAEARRAYSEHRDAQRALREFPPQFRFERQLLDHLARGHPPERALRALSRELRTLFVHAYQALLFNRYVTRRVARGLALGRPSPGDRLLRVARDGTVPGTAPVPVGPDNLTECEELAARGRAIVAGPLVGFATPDDPGPASEILNELLEEEGVGRKDFESPRSADLASAGSFRPMFVPLPPIGNLAERDPGADEDTATLHFSLPKGSYATILLREFLKTGARPSSLIVSKRAY
jgi:tRNA pseudouridine13 synthase